MTESAPGGITYSSTLTSMALTLSTNFKNQIVENFEERYEDYLFIQIKQQTKVSIFFINVIMVIVEY